MDNRSRFGFLPRMSDSDILKKIKLRVLRRPELVSAGDAVGDVDSDVDSDVDGDIDEDESDLPVFTHLINGAAAPPSQVVGQQDVETPKPSPQPIIEPDDTPKIHKASSAWEYFGARFSNFFVDFAISLIGSLTSWLALGLISRDLQAQVSPAFYFITIFFTVHLYMTLRGRNLVGAEYKMHVVDKRGKPLSWMRALVRTILVVLTLPLLPLNVIFLSVGSRKLLHDHLCGTHALHGDEDLKTSFYPSSSKWMAVLLVIFTIICAGVRFDFSAVVDRFSSEFSESMFGHESKLYFIFLRAKIGNDIPVTDWNDAKQKIPQMAQLADLQMKFEGAESYATARATLNTAIVAVYLGESSRADKYLARYLTLPHKQAEAALERRFCNTTDVNLYCATLYSRCGFAEKAILLADKNLEPPFNESHYDLQVETAAFLAKQCNEAKALNFDEEVRKRFSKNWNAAAEFLEAQNDSKASAGLKLAIKLLNEKCATKSAGPPTAPIGSDEGKRTLPKN